MNIKNIIMFITGSVIGGLIATIGTKKYFKDKYQKMYEKDRDALEEYYSRVDEYARQDIDKKSDEEEKEESAVETTSRPGGRMTAEERSEIKNKLKRNYEQTTNYANMYKINQNTAPECCENCFYNKDGFCNLHEENVMSSDDCMHWKSKEGINKTENTPEEEAFDDHRKNMNKAPKIISAEAYGELPAHIDTQVLYFYAYDEILVDEDDENEPITEPEMLIGDSLTKYGFIDSDERIIFVMNYATDTCYEIQKVDASWGDSH